MPLDLFWREDVKPDGPPVLVVHALSRPIPRFESRAIEQRGSDAGQVDGDLTLHGVTAPVILDVWARGGAENFLTGRHTLGFEATGVPQRTAFGIGSLVPAVGNTVGWSSMRNSNASTARRRCW